MTTSLQTFLLNSVLRAPAEGGSAASGAAGAAPGADGASGAGSPSSLREAAEAAGGSQGKGDANGAGTQGGQNGAGANWWAEGLPEHMIGKDERETFGKLRTALEGYRRVDSERGSVPKEASGYKFEPTDKIKPFVEGLEQDDLYNGLREDFRAAGVTDKQFAAAMPKILERILGTGLVGEPVDFGAMVMQLVPPEAKTLDEQGQRQAAGRRISEALAYVDGMKAQKAIPAEVADFLVAQLGDDPRGIAALEFFRGREGKAGPALGGRGGGVTTEADLDARLKDPRGDPDSPQFDRSFAQETDRLMQEFYGK